MNKGCHVEKTQTLCVDIGTYWSYWPTQQFMIQSQPQTYTLGMLHLAQMDLKSSLTPDKHLVYIDKLMSEKFKPAYSHQCFGVSWL